MVDSCHVRPEPIEAPEPQPVRVRDLVRHRALIHGYNVQQAGGAGVVPYAAFVAGVDAYELYRDVHDRRRRG